MLGSGPANRSSPRPTHLAACGGVSEEVNGQLVRIVVRQLSLPFRSPGQELDHGPDVHDRFEDAFGMFRDPIQDVEPPFGAVDDVLASGESLLIE